MTENSRAPKNAVDKEAAPAPSSKVEGVDRDKKGPSFTLVSQYLKDLSFENPNAVEILQQGVKTPKGNIKFDIRVAQFNTSDFEVILKILIESTVQENFKCLAEIEYAGLFHLQSVPVEAIEPLLMIEAPRMLFPFARQIIMNLSRDGVIPLPQLQPIDFAALYQERQRQLSNPAAESASIQ